MNVPPFDHPLCIGSVLWDVIGRTSGHMRQGSDLPGRIVRLPGGVAMNIAMTLARLGMRPALLSAIGRDREGDDLIAACNGLGMDTGHVYRPDHLPTDRYMAIEGANGLIAAIADAHSLEAAGARILDPLSDGRLGSAARPFAGLVALDGNLTAGLLGQIATDPAFAAADLRVAPASPGKADRLAPFLTHGRGTLYVNLQEAAILTGRENANAADAARALLDRGAARVLVTDGGRPMAEADADRILTRTPPEVPLTRVTGAGDTFMAAHIAAEAAGASRDGAIERALHAAATYVSGATPR